MRAFKPDTIIALGGGSPMDAAKVMWLLYEHPEVNFSDLREKFFDIRKRAFRFPELGALAQLVCIPTTSGTGAEVTPFAVITDPETGMKYPLADYALTPTVAIIDPVLTAKMPASLAADSGFDALTHATEAFVSVYANDFTDGMALQAIRLIFDNIATSVNGDRGADPTPPRPGEDAQCRRRSPAWPSATRFSGSCTPWRTPSARSSTWSHGRTNATLLPPVIRYNGTIPTKLTSWPKYEYLRCAERFQQIAKMLGLPAGTPEEGVESYARRRREPARQGRYPGLVPGAGRRRAGLHRPARRTGHGFLSRPVRAGQPADADARRHEGSDGGRLLRHLDRRGSRPAGSDGGHGGRCGRARCGAG